MLYENQSINLQTKSMDWFPCDVSLTEKSSQTDYSITFALQWKIYLNLIFFHERRWSHGPCSIWYLVCGEFPGTSSDILGHHRVEVCYHFGASDIKWHQKDTIALQQFNIRVSCMTSSIVIEVIRTVLFFLWKIL